MVISHQAEGRFADVYHIAKQIGHFSIDNHHFSRVFLHHLSLFNIKFQKQLAFRLQFAVPPPSAELYTVMLMRARNAGSRGSATGPDSSIRGEPSRPVAVITEPWQVGSREMVSSKCCAPKVSPLSVDTKYLESRNDWPLLKIKIANHQFSEANFDDFCISNRNIRKTTVYILYIRVERFVCVGRYLQLQNNRHF